MFDGIVEDATAVAAEAGRALVVAADAYYGSNDLATLPARANAYRAAQAAYDAAVSDLALVLASFGDE